MCPLLLPPRASRRHPCAPKASTGGSEVLGSCSHLSLLRWPHSAAATALSELHASCRKGWCCPAAGDCHQAELQGTVCPYLHLHTTAPRGGLVCCVRAEETGCFHCRNWFWCKKRRVCSVSLHPPTAAAASSQDVHWNSFSFSAHSYLLTCSISQQTPDS